MRRSTATAWMLAMLFVSTLCLAADTHAPAAPAHATTAEAEHAPHANQPVLPPGGIRWPAVMLMIVVGMFAAAVVIGVIVRMNMPEEVPDTHSHDESHGHDHPHGHGHDHGHGGHH